MKKTIKIANIVLVIAMIMLMLSNTVMAGTTPTTGEGGGASSVIGKLDADYNTNDQGITAIGQQIISWISIIAIVIAVIVLLILGIKYMIGSASEKAEYKKTMIPYLVGAVLIFGAGAIAQVIVNVATSLTATAGQG